MKGPATARIVLLGVFFAAVLGILYWNLHTLASEPVHVSSLVPEDARFAVVVRSLNDLGTLFQGPDARADYDPARELVGRPANIPDLDGVAFDRPVVRMLTADNESVQLLPLTAPDAFKQAFDKGITDIQLEAHRIGDYMALAGRNYRPDRDAPNGLIVRALDAYPFAVVVRPTEAGLLRAVLAEALFLKQARALPQPVAQFIVDECESFLLGLLPPSKRRGTRILVEATLVQGAVSRSAAAAAAHDPAALVRSFPLRTLLLGACGLDVPELQTVAGLVLDANSAGQLDASAAVAAGVVETTAAGRPYALLVLVSTPQTDVLVHALDGLVSKAGGEWEVTQADKTPLRTLRLSREPASLATLLRSRSAAAPPVYVSTAVQDGVWVCAVGARARSLVGEVLISLSGKRTMSLGANPIDPTSLPPEVRERLAANLAASGLISRHPEMLDAGHTAVGMVTLTGLKAVGLDMPKSALPVLSRPLGLTFVFDGPDPGGTARLELRLSR
ncbi:MAG: hypothetical protein ACE10D_11625 [Planctomycetota bacterium]